MDMTGGDILLRCLVNEGVKFIFALPGGQIAPILDAVCRWGKEADIQTISMRHEQACAHAADAWARITGEIGVCLATVGPGAADLVPGITAAWADSSPVLAITGQVWNEEMGKGATQGDLDQINLFKPITKWNKQIKSTEEIQKTTYTAFKTAFEGCPGPVHLDISTDALVEKMDLDINAFLKPSQYRPVVHSTSDPTLLKQAVEMLLKAERPLIVAGGGVMLGEAWSELQQLAEFLNIPVATSLRGTGAIPSDHSLYVPLIYPFFKAMHDADVILLIGSKVGGDLRLGQPPLWNDENLQKVIQIDIDALQIGKNRKAALGIVGDAKLALRTLHEIAQKKLQNPRPEYEWVRMLRDYTRKDWQKEENKYDGKIPIKPQYLAKEIGKFLSDESVIILDGGDITVYGLQYIRKFRPRSFLMSCAMGHLGFGLPAAIAAKLARPDAQVCALQGDGAFMFNVQELETAKRYNLSIVNVIGNNGSWAMIRNCQKIAFKRRFIDVDFGVVDYVKLAEAFGCYGERVEKPEEIQGALKRAFESNLPAIVDVVIDRNETPIGDSINYAKYVR